MNKAKRILVILSALLLCFTLTGCTSKKESKELAVITSIALDKTEEGTYQMFFEILETSGSPGAESSNGLTNKILVSEGRSVAKAINMATKSCEKRLFGGNNKVIFVTEEFARSDFNTLVELSFSDNLSDEGPIIVVLKDAKPAELFDAKAGMANLSGEYIERIAKSQLKSSSAAAYSRTLDVLKDIYEEGKQAVTGVLKLKEDKNESDAKIAVYEGLGVLKDTTLAGFLDADETCAYNIITKSAEAFLTDVAYDGTLVSCVGSDISCKVKTKLGGGLLTVDIDIGLSIGIYLQEHSETGKEPDNEKITALAADKIKENIYNTVTKVQRDYRSDIFGFGKNFCISNYSEWKNIKSGWDDGYFAGAAVNVNVNAAKKLMGQRK